MTSRAIAERVLDSLARDSTASACVTFGLDRASAFEPASDRPIEPGSLVTIDVAASAAGWHADAARCVPVGPIDDVRRRLLAGAHATRLAMLRELAPGRAWSAVQRAAHAAARVHGLEIVPGLACHAIGRTLHERALPLVGSTSAVVDCGSVLTLEPVVSRPAGRGAAETDATAPSATVEWTVAVTREGVRILAG